MTTTTMSRFVCPTDGCPVSTEALSTSTAHHNCKIAGKGRTKMVQLVRISATVAAPPYVETRPQGELDFLATIDCQDNLANTYEVLNPNGPVSFRPKELVS